MQTVTTPGHLGKYIFTVSISWNVPWKPVVFEGCPFSYLSETSDSEIFTNLASLLSIQLWWKMALIVRAKPGYISYGSKIKLLFTVIKAVLKNFVPELHRAVLQYNIVFSYAILSRACLSNPPRLA